MNVLEKKKKKTVEKNGKYTRERVRWHYLVECSKCGERVWLREHTKSLKKDFYTCQSCLQKKHYHCKECGVELPKKGEYCEVHKRSYCRKCGKQIGYLKHLCEDCKTIPKKRYQRMKESKECEYCGKTFFPLYGGFRMYCSRECGHKALKTLTPMEEEQRSICRAETKAFQRANYLVPVECAVCKTKENLHTHHYDYSKPYSVYTLCQKHHSLAHNGGLDLSTVNKTECEWNSVEIAKELKYKKTESYKAELLKKEREELNRELSILVNSLFGTPSTFREVVSKGTKIRAMIGVRHKSIAIFRQEWCEERGICKRCGNPVDECSCFW